MLSLFLMNQFQIVDKEGDVVDLNDVFVLTPGHRHCNFFTETNSETAFHNFDFTSISFHDVVDPYLDWFLELLQVIDETGFLRTRFSFCLYLAP